MYATVNWLNKKPLRLTVATTSVQHKRQQRKQTMTVSIWANKSSRSTIKTTTTITKVITVKQHTQLELQQQPQRIVAIASKCVSFYFYGRVYVRVCSEKVDAGKKNNGEK